MSGLQVTGAVSSEGVVPPDSSLPSLLPSHEGSSLLYYFFHHDVLPHSRPQIMGQLIMDQTLVAK